MTHKRILVVDDEPKILEVVAAFLSSRDYTVYTAATGREALALLAHENISLVVLDLMLPDISGEEVCAAVRRTARTPIIMLTAKSNEADQLNGLALGADDYVLKPFSLKVLEAKIEAVLRRSSADLTPLANKNSWNNNDLSVDFERKRFYKAGQPVALTPNEARILAALVKYPGKVFSREELIATAFKDDFEGYDRAVDTHIKNLRHKIEDNPKAPIYIKTIHGLGYQFGEV
ncbi:MAG TPA: response regulator transcription factor [Clostridia bacterium]|nr:response regulator transcription factor [Clostridia bacterium]